MSKAKRFYITEQGNFWHGSGFSLSPHWSVDSAKMFTKKQAEKELKKLNRLYGGCTINEL